MTDHHTSDHAQLEARYQALLVAQFRDLRLNGLTTDVRPIVLPLEEVYVQLRAVAAVPEAADAFTPEERRLLKLLEERRVPDAELREAQLRLDALRHQRWTYERPERFPISQALADPDKRGLVILGDPGSGKTTLLHLLALLFAQGTEAVAKHTPARGADADRLPIVAPLAAYDAALDDQPDLELPAFLAHVYARYYDLPGLAPVFEVALAQGRALLLLDGLDEVRSAARRRTVAERVTRFVQAALGRGNRAVVTSRIYGYRVAPLGGELPHVTVLDFGQEEIATFTRQWYRAVRRAHAGGELSVEVEQQAAEEERRLLDEITSTPGVERLAVNPLLLTLLVLLREQLGSLPRRRIELYDAFVATLLQRWEELRRRSAHQHDTPHPVDLRATEDALSALAFWLQQHRPSGTATAADLLAVLHDHFQRKKHGHDSLPPAAQQAARRHAEAFLSEMREHGGLLIERGQDAFGFRHLTFQEYFAGRALAQLPPAERWALLRANLHSGRWREPLRLCAARLGVSEGRAAEANALVAHVLDAGSEYEAQLHRDLLLAADCAADDIGLELPLLQRIVEALLPLLYARVPALVRAALEHLYRLWLLHAGGQATLPRLQKQLLVWLLEQASSRSGPRRETQSLLGRMARDGNQGVVAFLRDRHTDADYNVRTTIVLALAARASADADARHILLAALTDAEPVVRAAAIGALGSLAAADPFVRDRLCATLSDSDAYVRTEALQVLSSLAAADPPIQTLLLAALDDPYEAVRAEAVRAVRGLVVSEPHIRSLVCALLVDPDEEVQAAAVGAMAQFAVSDSDIRAALLTALAHEHTRVRVAVVEALGGLAAADGHVRAALCAALADHSPTVRFAAIQALGGLAASDVRVREALSPTLGDSEYDVRGVALSVLAPLADTDPLLATRLTELQTHRDWRTRWAALHVVAEQAAVKTSCDMLWCYEASPAQAAAMMALSRYASDDPSVRFALGAALQDEWWKVRAGAVQALGEMVDSSPQVREALLGALSDPETTVRLRVIEALGKLVAADQQIQDALCLALADPAPRVRIQAIDVLGGLAGSSPRIRAGLLAALNDPDANVRATTVRALGGLIAAEPGIRDVLLAALNGSDSHVQMSAIAALRGLVASDVQVREAIIAALAHEGRYVRAAAMKALVGLADTDHFVRDAFLTTLTQADTERRAMAIHDLAGFAPAGLEIWHVLVPQLSDPDVAVREAVVQALGKLGTSEPQLCDALLACVNDPDEDVRSEAVRALGQLAAAEPHLWDVLRSALNDPSPWVRSWAIEALSPLAGSDAQIRDELCGALSNPDDVIRAEAARALRGPAVSEPHIRAALCAALSDPHQEVRMSAIRSLGELATTDEQVCRALSGALADPDEDVREAAGAGLMPVLWSDTALYRRLLDAVGGTEVSIEVGQPKQRLPELVGVYGQIVRSDPQRRAEMIVMLGEVDWRRRKAAADILREAGPEAVREALPQLLAAVEDTRGYDSWPARLAAAERLINSDHYGEQALELIEEALTYGAGALFAIPRADVVREQAALALGKLKALHRRADLAARIVGLLETEQELLALDGFYSALGSLAAAPEPV